MAVSCADCFENEAFPLPPWLFPYLLKILEELISFLFMLFINILPFTLTRTQDVSFIFVFIYFFKTGYYYIAQSALELENLPSSGVVGCTANLSMPAPLGKLSSVLTTRHLSVYMEYTEFFI